MQFIDLPTLIIIIVAAVVIFRLRSVLGQRTGFDDADEYHKHRTEHKPVPEREAANENVVQLPTRTKEKVAAKNDPIIEEINKLAKPRTKLNSGMKKVYEADGSFSPASFLNGANMAYEMIVMAFADGDDRALKPLLSSDVYQGFKSAIDDRKERGEVVKSDFIGIDSSEITAAVLDNDEAKITARFESQIVTATYDADGKIVDGAEGEVVRVKDIWTFARDTRSRDPNWKLIATEAEG